MPQRKIYLTNCRPSHPASLCKIPIWRMGPARNTNNDSPSQMYCDLSPDVQLAAVRLIFVAFSIDNCTRWRGSKLKHQKTSPEMLRAWHHCRFSNWCQSECS